MPGIINAEDQGAWPDAPGPRGEITVGEWGAGLGDPRQHREVELAAMAEVTAAYSAQGWTVTDVSGECCGWDLTCERPGGEVARVEVKGVSGNRPVVLLTAGELRAARERFGWTLVVVTRALGDAPVLHTFTAREAVTAAVPYVFRAELTG